MRGITLPGFSCPAAQSGTSRTFPGFFANDRTCTCWNILGSASFGEGSVWSPSRCLAALCGVDRGLATGDGPGRHACFSSCPGLRQLDLPRRFASSANVDYMGWEQLFDNRLEKVEAPPACTVFTADFRAAVRAGGRELCVPVAAPWARAHGDEPQMAGRPGVSGRTGERRAIGSAGESAFALPRAPPEVIGAIGSFSAWMLSFHTFLGRWVMAEDGYPLAAVLLRAGPQFPARGAPWGRESHCMRRMVAPLCYPLGFEKNPSVERPCLTGPEHSGSNSGLWWPLLIREPEPWRPHSEYRAA